MKQLIWNLKNRSNMYLQGNDYNALVNFLVGYDVALKDHNKTSVLDNFKVWLQQKENKEFAYHWAGYILKEMADNDSDKAKLITLNLLDEFSNLYNNNEHTGKTTD